jgi:hypothetical protein
MLKDKFGLCEVFVDRVPESYNEIAKAIAVLQPDDAAICSRNAINTKRSLRVLSLHTYQESTELGQMLSRRRRTRVDVSSYCSTAKDLRPCKR